MALNFAALEALVTTEFQETIKGLSEEMRVVISDPQAFADQGFDYQDIVDTGRLRDSQSLTWTNQGALATFEWNPVDPDTGEAYAASVYKGFFAYDNPSAFVPGRKWPEKAVSRYDPVEDLAKRLRAKGLKVTVVVNNSKSPLLRGNSGGSGLGGVVF